MVPRFTLVLLIRGGVTFTRRRGQLVREVREWYGHIYTTKCKIDSYWEAAT